MNGILDVQGSARVHLGNVLNLGIPSGKANTHDAAAQGNDHQEAPEPAYTCCRYSAVLNLERPLSAPTLALLGDTAGDPCPGGLAMRWHNPDQRPHHLAVPACDLASLLHAAHHDCPIQLGLQAGGELLARHGPARIRRCRDTRPLD